MSGTKLTDPWLDAFYDKLAEDDEGRVCTGISEDACREVPGNFFKTLIANMLTSVGDRVASAKTTLPWLLIAAGAPAWCVSLLVPIRESGSMLPQMALGVWVRRRAVRKGFWAFGSLVQAGSLLGIGAAAMALEGLAVGLVVLGLLAIFSVGRALSSLAYKDVLGKTIPKTRRGRLQGWISAIAGVFTLAVGVGLGSLGESESMVVYLWLLAGAAVLWIIAAAVYLRIEEEPGETDGGENGIREAFSKWRLLRDDLPFRHFVIGRAFAMGSGLAAPFYVALAQRDLGAGASVLGGFIIAEGLAGMVSAPLWGRWADRSSRTVFGVSCLIAGSLSIGVALYAWLAEEPSSARWVYGLVFFGLGLAHAGVRLGRKTYLVDMAEGNRRTDYVAVSNSAMGVLLLLTGLVGAVTATFSVEATLILFGMMGLVGAGLSLKWKDVSDR